MNYKNGVHRWNWRRRYIYDQGLVEREAWIIIIKQLTCFTLFLLSQKNVLITCNMVNLYKCVVYQLSQNKTTVVGPMDPLLWLAAAWSTMPPSAAPIYTSFGSFLLTHRMNTWYSLIGWPIRIQVLNNF